MEVVMSYSCFGAQESLLTVPWDIIRFWGLAGYKHLNHCTIFLALPFNVSINVFVFDFLLFKIHFFFSGSIFHFYSFRWIF